MTDDLRPRRAATEPLPAIEPAHLMPFLVAPGEALSETAVAWALPGGLRAVAVEKFGAIYYLERDDLDRLGLSDDQAWHVVVSNLEGWAVETGFVSDVLEDGTPIVVHSVGAISSACVVLPGLHRALSGALRGPAFRLRVPHRDVMIAYEDTEAAEAAVRRWVLPEEAALARAPLVDGVLWVDGEGLRAD